MGDVQAGTGADDGDYGHIKWLQGVDRQVGTCEERWLGCRRVSVHKLGIR
jgi:hypothetical protein